MTRRRIPPQEQHEEHEEPQPQRQASGRQFVRVVVCWLLLLVVPPSRCHALSTAEIAVMAAAVVADDMDDMDDNMDGMGDDGTNNDDEEEAEIPWNELRGMINRRTVIAEPTLERWREQCVELFLISLGDILSFPRPNISNYKLMDSADGTCMSHVACIYDNCQFPTYNNPFPLGPTLNPFPLGLNSPFAFQAGTRLDFLSRDPERFNLPQRVLQPQFAYDIVQAVLFSRRHNVSLSVKVAGHSYMGSSTGQALLIKMSPSYRKYAINGTGLVECDLENTPVLLPSSTDSARFRNPDDWLCAYAVARGRRAYLRVGGGELGDEAYRAVSFEWNRRQRFNTPSRQRYHFLGPAAGTVAAAGGWMASGGLSGFTGTRMHGMAIDQVLQMEMVLTNGQHVRFGPTEWNVRNRTDIDQPNIYPQTNAVSGFCNDNAPSRDESQWNWLPCATPDLANVTWDDLWFAVRGGGGGTWGVVTSVYYQLHPYPGIMTFMEVDGEEFLEPAGLLNRNRRPRAFLFTYIEFLLRFLYRPLEVGVSVQQSNTCGSANTASLVGTGSFVCYGSAGNAIVSSWRNFLLDPNRTQFLAQAGFTAEQRARLRDIFRITNYESFAELQVSRSNESGVPQGRLRDGPRATLVPILQNFPDYVDSKNLLFPLSVLQGSEEVFLSLVQILTEEAFADTSGPSSLIYTVGGIVPQASDGKDSLSPTRRDMAFMKTVADQNFRNQYLNMFYGQGDFNFTQDPFPGSICHNHAFLHEMGPQKDDWTRACPDEWSQERRDNECISFDDATWGSDNAGQLLRIQAAADPDGILRCPGAVGVPRVPLEENFTLLGFLVGLTSSIFLTIFFNFCAP